MAQVWATRDSEPHEERQIRLETARQELRAAGLFDYIIVNDDFEEALRRLSTTDELTGLYNRRGFFLLAEQQRRLAIRRKAELLRLHASQHQRNLNTRGQGFDARVFGNDGRGGDVTPQTPFVLNSMAKSFTALAIMQFVEAGRVALSMKIVAGSPALRA